jgi:hypothetical protein
MAGIVIVVDVELPPPSGKTTLASELPELLNFVTVLPSTEPVPKTIAHTNAIATILFILLFKDNF